MTPHAFATQICTNHMPDGSCLGMSYRADGSVIACAPVDRCRMLTGERCAYFEECVAPVARTCADPRRARDMQQAVRQYHVSHGKQQDGGARACPDCGNPLPARARYCAACRETRRKAAYTAHKRRIRRNVVALSTVKPKTGHNSLGNSATFSTVLRDEGQDSGVGQKRALTVDIGQSTRGHA